jgi:hypothetical protein
VFLLNRKKIQQTKKATQSSGSTNPAGKNEKIRQQSSKGYIFGNGGYQKFDETNRLGAQQILA